MNGIAIVISQPIQSLSRRLILLMIVYSNLWFGAESAIAQEAARTKPRELSRSLPLPSRSGAVETEGTRAKSISSTNSLLSTAISLGLIVGAVLLAGRWLKWSGFQGRESLSTDAIELLGKRMLDAKTAVHIVKCGSRILVLGVGADGVRTLSEIDDPAEVERLRTACQPGSATETQTGIAHATRTPEVPTPAVRPRHFAAMVGLAVMLSMTPAAEAQNSRNPSTGQRSREQLDGGQRPRPVQQAAFEPEFTAPDEAERNIPQGAQSEPFVAPQQLGVSLKVLTLMTVFSLAPSILMMTTCYVRFIVALGLLRQAIGTQQGPPQQVLSAICLFLTFMVMSPVWQRSYQEGIRPYTNPAVGETRLDETTALSKALAPIRAFMSQQIDKSGNADAVWMLLDFQQSSHEGTFADNDREPQSYDDVPFTVLAPAYLLSELKVGFLIGFQLFLPFLVIDLVVASVLTGLGMTMMPPSMVSLPFKLLLFVLIDGWFLTIGMLLESVR